MSSPAARRRWIFPLCLGSALAVGACTKKGDGETIQPDGKTPDGTPAAIELAPIDHPSQMMPRDTAVLVTVGSMDRVAEVFERERLVEAFGPQYTSLSAIVRGTLGYDLFDPAEWANVGLDPAAPMGLAVTSAVHPKVVAFATIGDEVKLLEFLRATAGKASMELVETSYGAAKVLRPKGENDGAVVIRDRLVAFVFEEQGVDFAKQLVTMDPNVSLASNVSYRKSTGGLRAADLTMFFDIANLVEQANIEQEDRASEPQENWAQQELVEAQKRGDSPERLAELEKQVAEINEDQARWRKREEGERMLTELLASGIEGAGFTVTVKRSGPIFDGRIVADDEAFLRRLVSNREGAPVLNRAMNGAPLFCVSGQVGGDALIELLEAAAFADGKEFSSVLAESKVKTGLELDSDLKALAGASEMCLALEGELDPTKGDPADSLGLGVVVSLADEAKAKYLLAKVANSKGKLAGKMKKKGSGYTVEVPDWRTMYVQDWGSRIVISSDAELATRLAEGKPGSMPSKVRPAGARGAMDLPGTAASEAFDLSLGMLWLMAGSSSFGEPSFTVGGLSQEEMEKVPLSKKSKKARKALDKATAKLEKLEKERDAAEYRKLTEIMDPMGIVVAAATADARGFTVTGGQFLRVKSLGQVVESMLGATMSDDPLPEDKRKELDQAWEKRSEASQAFVEARTEDAERFLAKKKK